MKKLSLIIILVFLSSCIPIREPKIIIENNSNKTFDSIKVFTTNSLPTIFYSLKPRQKVRGKILFDTSDQGDGCYKILIYNNGDLFKQECFGYYTNGNSLNREFNVIIETDTIKIISK